MTVRNLKKPSLVYGLGVRSPFSSHALARYTPSDESTLLGWLEERSLRSNLGFEEAVASRIPIVRRVITRDESFTLASAQHLVIEKPVSMTIRLEGTPLEDLAVSLLVLDIRADTEIVFESEPSQRSVHLIYADVATDASFTFNDLLITAHDSFRRVRVTLGESSKVFPNHAFFTYGEAKVDLKSDITHVGRESFSDMKVRGVIDNASEVIVQGDVTIEPTAFEANGYQQEDLILASPNAIARPIPNLEIGNNQVKCSHGATVSSIDPEAVFYLRSRGIHEHDARTLLLASFIAPILELIPEEELERIREKVRRILDGSH